MKIEQEPKYIIEGQVVNRQSGHAIPDDEPVFLLRGSDRLATHLLKAYRDLADEEGCNSEHLDAVQHRVEQFEAFAAEHQDRMHTPDTQLTNDWEPK